MGTVVDPVVEPLSGSGIDRLLAPPEPRRGGGLLLWWLGQAGFALRHGDCLILIDPYLSDSLPRRHRDDEVSYQRLLPVPVDPRALRFVTWLLCTHGHGDHMDPDTIAAIEDVASPQFVVPRSQAELALRRGAARERLRTIDANESIELADGVRLSALPAAHEQLEVDRFGHRFLGYVIELAGLRLYHSGDCVPYGGLVEALRSRAVDIALLPVNGRDAWRRAHGVPGNFTVAEAVALCRRAQIGCCVPHHVGMFASNPPDGQEIARTIAETGAPLRALTPGRAYRILPGER